MFLWQLSKCLNHESVNLLLLVEQHEIAKLKEWLMLVFKPADNSSNQKILHCLVLLKAKDSLITYIHTYKQTLYYDSSIRGYSVIIYNNNK